MRAAFILMMAIFTITVHGEILPYTTQEAVTFDRNLAGLIDHTILKPEATLSQIDTLCTEALTYQFASVCIHPCWVKRAAENLNGSKVDVCTVVGFPLGANTTDVKVYETTKALEEGATEIDMVINIGAVKSGNWDLIENEIEAIVQAAQNHVVKVILEVALLTNEEIRHACRCAKRAGAHFVKTSTGFGPSGASIEAVQLMRETVGSTVGVKASGGVRSKETALQMIQAGANRIGTSSGIAIVTN